MLSILLGVDAITGSIMCDIDIDFEGGKGVWDSFIGHDLVPTVGVCRRACNTRRVKYRANNIGKFGTSLYDGK